MDVEAAERSATDPGGSAGAPEPERRRKRRRPGARRRLFMRVVRRSSLSIFLLVAAILVVAAQTDEGQELVLQATLDRVRGALAGELVVGGIRSGTLITGATLTNVRLDAAGGRRFLRADSVVVRYSLLSLLTGGTPIRSTTLWGVDVEISRPTEDDVLNVTRLIASGTKDSAGVNRARPVRLGRIGIRSGTVRLLTPASPGTALKTVPGPDGRPLQEIRFEELDLDLERAVVRPGAAVSFEAGLASLSGSVRILDEPLRIREVFGYATFGSQQGIRVEDGAFRLPSTLLRGDLVVGPTAPGEPWILSASMTVDGWGELQDLAWVDARMPDGSFRGSVAVRIPDEVVVDLEGFEAQLPASHILASGQMRFGEVMSLRSMEVSARPVVLDRLEPWLETEIPLDGWLSGRATFSGTLTDLAATGRVTLVPTGLGDGSPTTGDFSGVWHRGADPGATGMTIRFDDLNYSVIRTFLPALEFTGSGRGSIELEGRASSGLNVVADFTHEPARGPATESRFRARGRIWRPEGGIWNADLRGDVTPLSVGLFAGMAPELGLRGSVTGPVSATGPLDALEVTGELQADGGRVSLEAATDLSAVGSGYRVTAEAEAFPVSAISSEVPEATTWSGRLELEGRGLVLDSLETRATLLASGSRIGAVTIDSARAEVRIQRGVLITDTVSASLSGVQVAGRGRFGLAEGAWGSSSLSFTSDRITGLRPLVMGVPDDQIVIDDLDELERAFQVASGVDVDTLPTAEDIRLDGRVRGSATLSGEIRNFDLGLLVDVVDGAYKSALVDSARVAITAAGLPETGGAWGLGLSARGIAVDGRTFEQGGFEAEMSEREGTGRIEVVRNANEAYRATGSFRFDSIGGELGLQTGQIRVGEDSWDLARAAVVAWDDRSLSIDSLRIEREGDDPMSLTAHGTLARGGRSDFRVDVDGLHLDRIVHVGQFAGLQLGGHLDLGLSVTGPAESPIIDGSFHVDGPEYGAVRLTRLEGSLAYADQRTGFEVRGWDGDRDAVHAAGELPLDLSLALVDDRTPDLPMSMTIEADSLDAAIALSYLTSLGQVTGSVTGEVTVGGTLGSPSPEGSVSLSDAAWTIEAIGVRHSGVTGELTLNRNRTVDVSLAAGGRGAGSSTVTGTVRLEPFTDPPLDLTFGFDRFQAVDRLDVDSRISGQFSLGGTYRRPVASGALTLEETTVYVDEFRRAASVVDLSDPTLLDLGVGVDTTALVTQPLLAGLRNPFFDNLRVNIDLQVPRDTWLRSTETNVEMVGDLLVVYDRSEGDLVLVGELEALRGSHLVLNRSFELEGGTVSFIGRPGLNPDLDIEATTRIRRRDNPDLEVLAHVGGTLIQPVVTLSTDEVGIAEADLMSYLVFGQPSRELGSSQTALFRESDVGGAVTRNLEGGLRWYSGVLANQVGAAIAQGTPFVDYLSVQSGVSGFFGTQLEAGSYVGRDFFVVAVFQLNGGQSETQNTVRGVRVEWDRGAFGAEAFWEDRFLRSGSGGIPLPDLTLDPRVLGLFVFRDWGY